MKVTTTLDAGVLTITLADPDNRNALSADLLGQLDDAIQEAERDASVRVVVMTNEGHIFSAGADLNESSRGASSTHAMAGVFAHIVHSAKPYVGRIAGHAVAGGVGLACATDVSVAVDSATFGFTEVRVGVAPAIISTLCLPKMRRAEAAEAFLRGNRFSADEAVRLGLINRAVTAAELDAAVDSVVADLLLGAPDAVAATKRLLNEVPVRPFDEAIAWATDLSSELFGGHEAAEGIAAYLEKRPPAWAPDAE